jgi:DNA modification methylase
MPPLHTLHHGDCLDVLPRLAEGSVTAIVTDPPYGLEFMGAAWDSPAKMLGQRAEGTEKVLGYAYGGAHSRGYADHDGAAFQEWFHKVALELLRVLKPGGHLLAFGASRTYHRMACAIEDAGFEVRDSILWLRGGGAIPKSLDVAKAIDKAAGARGHEGKNMRVDGGVGTASYRATVDPRDYVRPAPITAAAKAWDGWGTALKTTHEPIVLARKPLIGTVAANVLAHGTGALNIAACRVGDEVRVNPPAGNKPGTATLNMGVRGMPEDAEPQVAVGRWPSNVLLGHSPACAEACAADCPVAEVDRQADAARYFSTFRYVSKTSRAEREQGCDDLPLHGTQRNHHPTVKPQELMRWLVRLAAVPGSTVLDPFMGSGTTGMAALAEGCDFIGIEREAEYHRIASARVMHAAEGLE